MIIPPENLEDIARKFGFGKYAKKKIVVPITEPEKFSITEDEDYYIINGVKIKDEWKKVKWAKRMPNISKVDWVEKMKEKGMRIPSLPTYITTIVTLYDNTDIKDQKQKDLIEVIRKMFEIQFDRRIRTSTLIKYNNRGPDRIIHNFGSNDTYIINEEIIGRSDWITQNSGLERVIKALTGMDDLDKIKKTIEWMSTKKPYLCIRDLKYEEEKIVTLGKDVNKETFFIDCDAYILNWPVHAVIVEDMDETK